MKSTSSACSTSASAKCPMRTLAITGIVTVFIISRMTLMEAMRATPPSLRMSDGTRSSAITAHAPAFSAIFACSAVVTSMITPPLSISASPTLTRHSFAPGCPLPLPFTFFESIKILLSLVILYDARLSTVASNLRCTAFASRRFRFLADNHKSCRATRQNFPGGVSNLAALKNVSPFRARLKRFHRYFFIHMHRLQILNVHLRRHCPRLAKPANFSHRLIQQRRDNPAVTHAAPTLVPRPKDKLSNDSPLGVVLRE